MIVSESRNTLYCTCSILLTMKVYKSKALQERIHITCTNTILISQVNSVCTAKLSYECKTDKQMQACTSTFEAPVFLSLARYILEMLPNGLNNSWRSSSLVSSERLVTRIVARSSTIIRKHDTQCRRFLKQYN